MAFIDLQREPPPPPFSLPLPCALGKSLDLLFQCLKFSSGEKFIQRDAKTVAQLFNGSDGGTVISPAGNVVDGGLRNTAEGPQLIDGDAMDAAKLQYAEFYCGSYRHFIYPDLNELIQEYPF